MEVPKKPTTPYFAFQAENRPRIKAANPDTKVADISKIIGTEWHALSDKDKKKYFDLTEKDKTRYAKEVEKYEKQHGKLPEKERKNKSNKKVKDPNAPKRPMNAFMYFAKENRQSINNTHPEAKQSEIAKLLGTEWTGMNEKKKKKYVQLAEKDKERYVSEKANYDK